MAAGDTRVADPVDNVHYEITVQFVLSHHVYKSVWSRKQLVLKKEPAGQSTQ